MKTLGFIIGLPLLISYFYAVLLKQKIALVLPLVYVTAVFWLFIFSIYDRLPFAFNTLGILFGCLILLTVILRRRSIINKELLLEFFSPGILVFSIGSIWMYSHSRYMRFYEWDEFSYWGTAVKSLFLFDKVSPYTPNSIAFPEYIPGAPLFPYLVTKINGFWHEGNVFWAYQVILLSLFALLLFRVSWKSFKSAILVIPMMLLSFTFFYNSFQTVYPDALMSIIFGALLVLATSKELIANRLIFINLIFLSIYLSLIKDIGIFFAAIILIVGVVKLFVHDFLKSKRLIHSFFLNSGWLVLGFVLLFLNKILWANLLQEKEIFTNRSFTDLIIQFFSGNRPSQSTPYWNELTLRFSEKFSEGKLTQIYSATLSSKNWIVILSIVLIFMVILEKDKLERKTNIITTSMIISGFFAYLIVLLFLYATVFSENEALGLASFERYVSAYLAGVVIFITFKVFANFSNREHALNYNWLASCWLILFLFQSSPGNIVTYFTNPNFQSDSWRNAFGDRSWLIAEVNLPKDSKVWIIAQHTVGYEFYLFQYELLPASVGKIPWSIGSPSGPGDLWTDTTYDAAKWNNALDAYDYVFVNNVTETFISEFGNLFEDPGTLSKPGIYQIDHTANGNILIKLR